VHTCHSLLLLLLLLPPPLLMPLLLRAAAVNAGHLKRHCSLFWSIEISDSYVQARRTGDTAMRHQPTKHAGALSFFYLFGSHR
jgi:hypothetical protein